MACPHPRTGSTMESAEKSVKMDAVYSHNTGFLVLLI